MRWPHFIVLQLLIVAILGGAVYLHKEKVTLVKNPPASIAQWYKPENKRQVWLHTMFNLRREIQAIGFYIENENPEQLQLWIARLDKHYRKIGEMVPEWKKKLDLEVLTQLQVSAREQLYDDVLADLDGLTESCDSCHRDYRAITALTYRAPNFSAMEVASSVSLDSHMEELVKQVNQIKIAAEAGMKETALSSLSDLKKGMNTLGEVCSSCHKDGSQVYPSVVIEGTIKRLEERLASGSFEEQGKELGTLAVQACAACHGTHRLSYDAKNIVSGPVSWLELIKH